MSAAASVHPIASQGSATTPAPGDRRVIYLTAATLAMHITRILEINLTTKTLANWRSAGRGPTYVRVGRSVRYRLRDVESWIASQRRNAAAAAVDEVR